MADANGVRVLQVHINTLVACFKNNLTKIK